MITSKKNIKEKDVDKKKVVKKKKTINRKSTNKDERYLKKTILKIKSKFNKEKELYNVKEVICVMLFSLGIGFIMCFGCMSLFTGKNYLIVVKDLEKIVDTYYSIVDNYYGELDKNKLIDGAVEGMISSVGDIYTSYTDAENTESFDETISGSYEGIGCSVATYSDGRIIIVDVFEGSPADVAGLKVNDRIIKIDNETYAGKTSKDMADYIKNSGKDSVVLTIMRDDLETDVTVSLRKVDIPHVSGEIIDLDDKKIGYIDISLFSDNSYKQFKNKLEELEKENINGLIIDVRDNNGGYLTSVKDICSLFLEKGKIIYQLEDADGVKKKKDTTKEKRDYEVVVIINEASASASEILASAIKESYGKGTVQQTKKLLDGSMIKYTTQLWLTPNGNSINQIGVVPTDYVKINEDFYSNPSMDADNQLQEAISLLKK